MPRILPVLVLCLLAVTTARAQMWDPRALEGDPATATQPLAPKLTGLGDATHPVSTQNPGSQAFFDQGLRLTYGFNHSEAVRAFKEAARLDPDNAMAYWGWALALGSNLNLPMQPEAVPQAYDAVKRALAKLDQASPAEQAYIRALARRYSPDPEADRAALDRAYAAAMAEVAARWPDDLDAATLYADALMNLSPWNYWYGDGRPQGQTERVIEVLESVLARNPDHAGAIHLYIHILEASRPGQAEASADRLVALGAGTGHMIHMASHIFMRVGRYEDSRAANRRAKSVDDAYFAEVESQGIYPFLYYSHNIHFNVWAGMLLGDSAAALADARTIAAHLGPNVNPDMGGFDEYFLAQPLYVLARFGRWDEILAEPLPPGNAPYLNGLSLYARGLAYVHTDKLGKARQALAALRKAAADPALEGKVMGFAPTATLLDMGAEILASELDREAGRRDEAIARLDRAVRLEDGLPYNEPPDWYFPVRHYLGAALLDAGRPVEAETVYWQDLSDYPGNGWSLLGLERALAAQGRDAEAADIARQRAAAWASADVTPGSSRF